MLDKNKVTKVWEAKKLSELIDEDGLFCDGDWIESKDQNINGEVRLIQLADIRDGYFRDKSERYLTLKRAIKLNCTFLKKGDVLVARMPDPLGRCCLFPLNETKKYVTVVDVVIIRPDEKICDKKYLSYIINSPQIRNEIDHLKSGTTRKRISRKNLNTIDFPIPPIDEQLSIVSKIEELLSDLENGKQQLLLAQQQLKVYRQSLLKWAFKGKLTNKEVNGELPEDWKWVKNKDLLNYVTSGSRDWKKYYSSKGSRFVRTQDINSNKLDFGNAAYVDLPEKVEGKRSLIEEYDILMTITGANVGKVAVVDFPIKDAYVSQSVALLKYKDKRITKYIWYYFQAPGFGKSYIDKLVYGVGRPVLSLENMREVEVLICPIEDQKLIIEELESKLTVCENIEETISLSLQKAETLRQSILKKAFEGKLVTIAAEQRHIDNRNVN